jgi:alpha-beta hydrolase superfamily lysophospholipase
MRISPHVYNEDRDSRPVPRGISQTHASAVKKNRRRTCHPSDFDFFNAAGERLAALLASPIEQPRAYALFAHCFTCGKDIHSAKRIAEGLTALGIAVLRFDFTGLGSSEGEFANTTFSSNVADLIAAAAELRRTRQLSAILVGHSLGGAAVLAAAGDVPEARAVVTIGAPCDPAHVTRLFKDRSGAASAAGDIEVALGGRSFRISRAFLDDIAEQKLSERIATLRKALLVFHSPTDEIVGIENASRIFTAAKHPKSFVSLAGADHLLSRRSDATYVANVIHAWAERYLDLPSVPSEIPQRSGVIVRETRAGRFQQEIAAGRHRLLADEPVDVGGLDRVMASRMRGQHR